MAFIRIAIDRPAFFVVLLLCLLFVSLSTTEQVRAAPASGQQQTTIEFLNQAIGWYRMVNAAQSLNSEPADVVFIKHNRQLAVEVVRLAFQFAKSDVAMVSVKKENAQGASSASDQNPQSAQAQDVAALAAQAAADAKQAQADLDDLQSKLPTTRGKKLTVLRSAIAEKRSELDLANTRSKALSSFTQFLSAPGVSGSKGLSGQIEELQRSVPETRSDSSAQEQAPANASAPQSADDTQKHTSPTGVVAIGTDLISLTRKLHDERALLVRTNAMRESVTKLHAPLVEQLRTVAQQGDQLAAAPLTTDIAQLQARTQQIEALTAQFKRTSEVATPLGKMVVLLDSASSNTEQWRDETERAYATELRTLGLRLAILALAIGAIFLASYFWQRATLRYVRDVRRRSQLMLLRRVTVMAAIVMVVTFALVTELGSIATFAGFITAGLAIALQNVILSVVAYFFLIGKYGIRTGDRVQISGISGNVIDVGLVRLHLMEVDSSGAEEQLTGRIVVFSNSVLFQPNASFFRQAPGTNFGWRRVSLTLALGTNYRLAEHRLMSAVEREYSTYRQELERQFKAMEASVSLPLNSPQPHSRMKISDSGLEMVIRYPVLLDRVSAIDDQITRALVQAITSEPQLRLTGSGTANIQPVPDVPQPAPTATGISTKDPKGSAA